MYEQQMKNAKLKVTRLRLKVIEYMVRYFQHGVTVDSFYMFLIKRNESITISTLYRILREFAFAGIVTTLENDKKHFYQPVLVEY